MRQTFANFLGSAIMFDVDDDSTWRGVLEFELQGADAMVRPVGEVKLRDAWTRGGVSGTPLYPRVSTHSGC